MKPSKSFLAMSLAVAASGFLLPDRAVAHPHVFVEANIEVVRDDDGNFTEVRQVWRFDELFSTTVTIDYDENVNGKLDQDEIEKVAAVVKESIAEYDFYTAVRAGKDTVEFYEPEEIGAYFEGEKLIMFLTVELVEPVNSENTPLRISASDTSYYVAFDFDNENVSVSANSAGCETSVVHPDFDSLYADNSQFLTESFFSDPQSTSIGDEFYSWATITCS
ncbi:MAG: DUF1007 family protein [Pseudomonadota bacterium]